MEAAARAESDALHARVRAFAAAGVKPGAFDALARDVLSFQARHVRPFARLLEGTSRSVESTPLRELPGLPTDVFRLARVAAHPGSEDVRVFRTSGTTSGARGEHALRTTETYSAVALAWGRAMLFPDVASMDVVLLGDPAATDSSLGFMMELFATSLGGEIRRPLCLPSARAPAGAPPFLRLDLLKGFGARPVLVLGASFAFVHLLERAPGHLPLPAGSRVMQTGGFKGRSREVDAGELRRAIAEVFSVPEELVVSEYGMTELTSQAYEGTALAALGLGPAAPRGAHVVPPWMRADAVHPETFEPLPAGERGLLRLLDLANVDSCALVQTADLGFVDEGGVRVLGRLPGATARGCSLAMDEALG